MGVGIPGTVATVAVFAAAAVMAAVMAVASGVPARGGAGNCRLSAPLLVTGAVAQGRREWGDDGVLGAVDAFTCEGRGKAAVSGGGTAALWGGGNAAVEGGGQAAIGAGDRGGGGGGTAAPLAAAAAAAAAPAADFAAFAATFAPPMPAVASAAAGAAAAEQLAAASFISRGGCALAAAAAAAATGEKGGRRRRSRRPLRRRRHRHLIATRRNSSGGTGGGIGGGGGSWAAAQGEGGGAVDGGNDVMARGSAAVKDFTASACKTDGARETAFCFQLMHPPDLPSRRTSVCICGTVGAVHSLSCGLSIHSNCHCSRVSLSTTDGPATGGLSSRQPAYLARPAATLAGQEWRPVRSTLRKGARLFMQCSSGWLR